MKKKWKSQLPKFLCTVFLLLSKFEIEYLPFEALMKQKQARAALDPLTPKNFLTSKYFD